MPTLRSAILSTVQVFHFSKVSWDITVLSREAVLFSLYLPYPSTSPSYYLILFSGQVAEIGTKYVAKDLDVKVS